MATDRYAGNGDPYTMPNGVLVNKLGITTTEALNRAEGAIVAMRYGETRHAPITGGFDLPHLNRIHKTLFGDVYPWAGQPRTVDIAKGDTLFAHHRYIEKEGNKLFGQLAKEGLLVGLNKAAFAERAGHYLAEINTLHPYREGNGRTSRAFIGMVARNAGYWLETEGMGRDAMTKAAIAGFHGDSGPMAKLIGMNLRTLDEGPSFPFRQQTPAVLSSINLMKEARTLEQGGDSAAAIKLERSALRLASDIGRSGRYNVNPFSEESAKELFDGFNKGRATAMGERIKGLSQTKGGPDLS